MNSLLNIIMAELDISREEALILLDIFEPIEWTEEEQETIYTA